MTLVALGAAVLVAGCATRNAAKDRLAIVEAEAGDARLQAQQALEAQAEAQRQADRMAAEAQQLKLANIQKDGDLRQLEAEAARGQQAQQVLALAYEDQQRQLAKVKELNEQVFRLSGLVEDAQRKALPPEPSGPRYRSSEALEAFRRDLEARLRAQGVNLPVETRMTGDEVRVAVVLRGAFPAGKHAIAHNMDAVKAVVGLGELIASEYPSSRVRVEGHTDATPIKNSPYRSNEELSLKRAESVRELLEKAGVHGGIETVGHGARVPLESGSTKRAYEMNRRVEIYILPNS